MNATLRQNTIARIERHGFIVADSGGKRAPHAVNVPGPFHLAIQKSLTDDELYTFAETLDALDYAGRLTKVEP